MALKPPTARQQATPPSWRPQGNRGMRLELQHALVPLSLVILALLAFVVRVPWAWLVPVAIAVPVLQISARWYLWRRLPAFERAFNTYLQVGDLRGMLEVWRRSTLLRWVMPSWMRDMRLGMMYLVQERYQHAERLLEEAYDAAPPSQRVQLLGPLARTKYALQDWVDLRAISEQWKQRAPYPGTANLYLAASLLNLPGGDSERADQLLGEAEGWLSDAERKLHGELVLVAAKRRG